MNLLAYIPYFEVPPLKIGPLELHAFGALAALGILAAARIMAYAARTYQPGDDGPLVDMAPIAVLGGLVGGHLLHVLGYHPEILEREGIVSLLKVWDGLSSMGGVLGGLIAIIVYFRYRGWKLKPYLNPLAMGVAPGWAIARIGCFVAHDHPGVLTDFPFAVAFPDGARHDLGLYDMLVLGALSAIIWLLARKQRPQGLLMGVLAIGYAIPRFLLDFLRAQDMSFVDGRIAGLTPAQWLAFPILVVGVVLVVRARAEPPSERAEAGETRAPNAA